MNILDFIILIASLCLVLLVGLISGKRSVQEATTKEYLLAGNGINKLQVGFSMAATDFGGSGLVGAIGYCYLVGMSGIWWNLAAAPAFLLVGLFLAKKFNKMDCATLPEFFGKRYNAATKYLACLMHILANIASLAIQFTVSCTVLHVITGIPMEIALVISLLIVLLLTSGGLRTVVNTDAMLFVIIVSSVFISVILSTNAVGGMNTLFSTVPKDFLKLDQLGVWTPISWILLCMLSYSTSQNYIQRMVSSKDEGTATFGALFTAGFYVVISISLGIIGMAASILLPGVKDTNAIFPMILMKYFPHGFLGLGLAAVFAATISTGTSILHATVTLFINDIYIPLFRNKESKNMEKRNLLLSRISVVVIALFSLVISLCSSNIINICYVGGLFYAVSSFMPMVFGMYCKFVTAKSAFISIVVTVISSLIWEYFPELHNVGVLAEFPSNLFGIIISAIIICIVSFIEYKRNRGENYV